MRHNIKPPQKMWTLLINGAPWVDHTKGGQLGMVMIPSRKAARKARRRLLRMNPELDSATVLVAELVAAQFDDHRSPCKACGGKGGLQGPMGGPVRCLACGGTGVSPPPKPQGAHLKVVPAPD